MGRSTGEGIKPPSKAEALTDAKYAGLSLDRCARLGVVRGEGDWLVDGREIQGGRVIVRTISTPG
ncbi:MAG: hypothetical protein WD425_19500 [Nitrospirales bacterium]